MTGQYYQQPPTQQPYGMTPSEVNSIKSLVRIAGIFGIIAIVIGIIIMIVLFVIFWPLALAGLIVVILGYVFYDNCNKINEMVDRGQYQQAKSKTLIWMIIGMIFMHVIRGIILLVAYMKVHNLINASRGVGYMPAPPLQLRVCLGCGQQIEASFNVCPHCGKQAKP